MPQSIIADAKNRMEKTEESLRKELATVRAGRATPSLLDKVTVDYYGAITPLNQLATISAPEARLLVIQPFDKSSISDMEKAIQKADLGLTPANDGQVIRINIPALTEERRKDLVKVVKKYGEDAKVSIRNIRRDANDALKKLEKNGDISEDDLRGYNDDIQELTDAATKNIDKAIDEKEKGILEV
ncbi:ribosome recycling factor [Bacillaceae bacterium SIJ1]|uniref:ribosome recycling factor n=1 Tax=Litoribacterium kuwaitense TaxID=1398745 RepID=UPI0013EAD8BA|nr:ribosome recycling factor [Litoribacterium kuwaitense]NGP44098.1 ribosome recycling factor [Litoribacterium kuwaitense]